MYTIGLDREVYAQEETKEMDGVKEKPMRGYFFSQEDEFSDHSPLNVKGDRLSS